EDSLRTYRSIDDHQTTDRLTCKYLSEHQTNGLSLNLAVSPLRCEAGCWHQWPIFLVRRRLYSTLLDRSQRPKLLFLTPEGSGRGRLSSKGGEGIAGLRRS